MAIETKLAIFKDKHGLSDDAMTELKTIFDLIIVEFAHKIMNTESSKTIPKLDTTRVIYAEKKFATKIAAEYAAECNVTIDEIPSETGKVTKKDVEKYQKNKSGGKSKKTKPLNIVKANEDNSESETETVLKTNPGSKSKSKSNPGSKSTTKTDFETESECETKKIISKKDKTVTKEKCNGVTKDGNPCNLNATKTPDGSKKCYCFRHAIDWKQYEVSSDSDFENEIEREEKDPVPNKKLVHEDIDTVDSD
jgi:NADH:ubiquinone oxidoreductase subunit